MLSGHGIFLISENVGEQVVQLMQPPVVLQVGEARLQLSALDLCLVLHLLEIELILATVWPWDAS
jgi:hypothetical protein